MSAAAARWAGPSAAAAACAGAAEAAAASVARMRLARDSVRESERLQRMLHTSLGAQLQAAVAGEGARLRLLAGACEAHRLPAAHSSLAASPRDDEWVDLGECSAAAAQLPTPPGDRASTAQQFYIGDGEAEPAPSVLEESTHPPSDWVLLGRGGIGGDAARLEPGADFHVVH